jgi:signal peptidase II
MTARWPRPLFYIVTLLALALDQLTKVWAMASLQPIETMPLIPGFFSLTFVQNRGIAFGMFAGHAALVGIVVIGLILVAIYNMQKLNWAGWEPNIVGGCLCGGALGNLLDRARHGWVVDFFDVHIASANLYWPVFNVADSLICVAVGWIVLRQFGLGPKAATAL